MIVKVNGMKKFRFHQIEIHWVWVEAAIKVFLFAVTFVLLKFTKGQMLVITFLCCPIG
jgi:hypothetical protein